MKRLVAVTTVLALVAGSSFATPLIGRSGAVSKPLQVLGWLNLGYNQTAIKYDFDTLAWLKDTLPVKTTSCDVTIGLGLPARLELDAVAPLAMKEKDGAKSSGLGDVMVYARYGLLQSGLLPAKAALVLGANLPTAAKDANPTLGDRTTDIGVGLAVVTRKVAGLVGHARAGYWLNGKLPDTDYKVGNMIEYMLVADYSLTSTLMPQLAVSGYSRAKNTLGGTSVANSEVSQHAFNVLLLWKPLPMLVIRPKVALPLTFISKGGSLPKWYGGLDIWATFP